MICEQDGCANAVTYAVRIEGEEDQVGLCVGCLADLMLRGDTPVVATTYTGPELKCDFCVTRRGEVMWAFRAGEFSVPMPGMVGIEFGMDGLWAACDACKGKVEGADAQEMVEWVLGQMARAWGLEDGEQERLLREGLKVVYDEFYARVRLPAVAI